MSNLNLESISSSLGSLPRELADEFWGKNRSIKIRLKQVGLIRK